LRRGCDMSDNTNNFEELQGETCFLIDEEGKESPFEIVGSMEIDGVTYVAFMPIESDECEYVILKKECDEDGEDVYVTIDDDEEFDSVAEAFEDQFFADFNLDDIEDDEEE